MKNIIASIFIASLYFIIACDSDPIAPPDPPTDIVPGIFGTVRVYNEYGKEEESIGVQIKAVSYSQNLEGEILVSDTLYTESNNEGFFKFDSCADGTYQIYFIKEGYGRNRVYLQHDSYDADTIEDIVPLAKTPPASLTIDAIYYDSLIYSLTRTIDFKGTSDEFAVVSRYFLDTTENVSKSNYITTFISGAKYGTSGSTNTLEIDRSMKSIGRAIIGDSVLMEGDKIYIIGYLDNKQAYSYFNSEDSIMVFPNLTEPSNVKFMKVDTPMLRGMGLADPLLPEYN